MTTRHGNRCLLVLAAVGIVLAACGGGSSGSSGTPGAPSASALDVFDAVWSDFDANYSFFGLKAIDWDDSRARFRSQLVSGSSDQALFTALSGMLLELEDPHVRLTTPFADSTYTGWFDQFPTNFDESVITATYLGSTAMMSPATNMLFGRVGSDIGYFRVHSLSGSGYGDDIDFILGELTGVRAMIVDLRSNGGGNDQNGEAIAARFADTTRLYRRVRFRDGAAHDDFGPFIDGFIAPGGARSFQAPVAVLTNRGVISSAESLLLAFNVLPNAESIGDFSAGGSANPAQRNLANGWQYTVSRWIEFRPDGTTFEGLGIEPDIRVDISDADAAALRDTIMDTAILSLQSRLTP